MTPLARREVVDGESKIGGMSSAERGCDQPDRPADLIEVVLPLPPPPSFLPSFFPSFPFPGMVREKKRERIRRRGGSWKEIREIHYAHGARASARARQSAFDVGGESGTFQDFDWSSSF